MDVQEMDKAKETKGLIHNVLTSSKQTLTIKKLNSEYYQLVGNNIPYATLGFPSLELYLRSLYDILQIYGNGESAQVHVIVGDKSAHIRELICKQREPKKSAGRGGSRKGTFAYNRTQNFNQRFNMTNQMLHAINQKNNFFHRGGMGQPIFGFNPHIPSLLTLPIVPPNFNNAAHSSSYNIPNRYMLDFANRPSFSTSRVPSLSKAVQPNVVIKTPHNNSCNKTDELCSQDKSQADKAQANFSQRKETDLTEVDEYFSDEGQLNTKIPQAIQDNLRKLISNCPKGVWCSEIPNAYKMRFGEDLNYVDYGYTSLPQMCMDMGNSFRCVQPRQGDYQIFDKQYSINVSSPNVTKKNECRQPTTDLTELALPQDGVEDLLSSIHNVSIPSNTVKLGEFIERQWIDRGTDYLDVNIGEIYNPSKFWVNLCERRNQLNTLMNDMQSFYEMNSKVYETPHFMLKPGLYVAAVFLNEYHRALIIDEMHDFSDKIKLFFIDYGTVSIVNSSGVCYLCKQFAKLPAQGIRAKLAGIRPLVQNENWPRRAALKFQMLVEDKDLVAQIINVDEEKEILDVVLCDTTGEDFFINDALVIEELAVFSQIDDFAHIHPTFAELENAENPTSIYNRVCIREDLLINDGQNLRSKCSSEKLLDGAGTSGTGNVKYFVKHVSIQTDNCNLEEQLQSEYKTSDFNFDKPMLQEVNGSEDDAFTQIQVTNFQNTHHNKPVISLTSTLNPSAVPFHPKFSQNVISANDSNPPTSLNNANNYPIYNDLFANQNNSMFNSFQKNQYHSVILNNRDQGTCTTEFSVTPLNSDINLENAEVKTKPSVINKCFKDSKFKIVTKTMLQGRNVHVIVYNDDDDYCLVDEIVCGLLGTTLSIVQIRKMFVGTQKMIPTFITINLKEFLSLKEKLLEHSLIQDSTTWINIIPLSYLLNFMSSIATMLKTFYISS